jgi:drug/metabolite transporter (DMT)-like permease
LIGQPVLVALLGIPLVGEFLQPYQWLGGLIVLAGILIIHRSREKEPTAEEITAPEAAGN